MGPAKQEVATMICPASPPIATPEGEGLPTPAGGSLLQGGRLALLSRWKRSRR